VKRRDVGHLVVVGIIATLVIAAAVLASEVLEQETAGFDSAILHAMRDARGAPVGPAWLQRAIIDLSTLGSTTIVSFLVVVACAFLVLSRHRRHAVLLATCAIGTAIAVGVLKAIIGRDRPDIIAALDTPGGYSFPSGHTLTASAIYPLLAFLLADLVPERGPKIFAFVIAGLIAFTVGFSRVYLGVHYPTDVIAGWSLGLAWALACGLAITRFAGVRPRADLHTHRQGPGG
jgi:undecaprenyl-diphosphatase